MLTALLAKVLTPRKVDTPQWDRWRELLARSGDRQLWDSVSGAYSLAGTVAWEGILMNDAEQFIAQQACKAVDNAVYRLDRQDGRLHARAARRAHEWVYDDMAARLQDDHEDPPDVASSSWGGSERERALTRAAAGATQTAFAILRV